MTLTAVTNARTYDWQTWLLGLFRSFLSGGAVALATFGGASAVGLDSTKTWKMVGINFIAMGLYRLGEFLQLHGAPDKLGETLQVAADATAKAGEAIATAKTQAEPKP
jgi:hypothetical protein